MIPKKQILPMIAFIPIIGLSLFGLISIFTTLQNQIFSSEQTMHFFLFAILSLIMILTCRRHLDICFGTIGIAELVLLLT